MNDDKCTKMMQQGKSQEQLLIKKPRASVASRPRRPLSAYNLFFRSEQGILKDDIHRGCIPEDYARNLLLNLERHNGRKYSNARFQAVTCTIAARWKKLPMKERATFDDMAKEEMEVYVQTKTQYQTSDLRAGCDSTNKSNSLGTKDESKKTLKRALQDKPCARVSSPGKKKSRYNHETSVKQGKPSHPRAKFVPPTGAAQNVMIPRHSMLIGEEQADNPTTKIKIPFMEDQLRARFVQGQIILEHKQREQDALLSMIRLRRNRANLLSLQTRLALNANFPAATIASPIESGVAMNVNAGDLTMHELALMLPAIRASAMLLEPRTQLENDILSLRMSSDTLNLNHAFPRTSSPGNQTM